MRDDREVRVTVNCSPLPVARLAAAPAAIEEKRTNAAKKK